MGVNKTRVEEDLLGKKEVPIEAYDGIQSVRAEENVNITGHALDRELIIALAQVKKAAAIANMAESRLEQKIGKATVQATDEITDGKSHDHFIVDPIQGGAGTSTNMNANEVIANRSLEILGETKGNYDI